MAKTVSLIILIESERQRVNQFGMDCRRCRCSIVAFNRFFRRWKNLLPVKLKCVYFLIISYGESENKKTPIKAIAQAHTAAASTVAVAVAQNVVLSKRLSVFINLLWFYVLLIAYGLRDRAKTDRNGKEMGKKGKRRINRM